MQLDRVETGVAGVTFEGRQTVLAALYQAQHDGDQLDGALCRQPGNKHDRNAIEVHIRGCHVGYIPRVLAAKLAPRKDAGERFRVASVQVIRGDHENRVVFGVRIMIEAHSASKGEEAKCQQNRLL